VIAVLSIAALTAFAVWEEWLNLIRGAVARRIALALGPRPERGATDQRRGGGLLTPPVRSR
jgi:hypothetical protein